MPRTQYEPAVFGDEFAKKLREWQTAEDQLAIWKEKEADLRREVCETLFDNKTGAFKVNLIDREVARVKATSKVNINMDRDGVKILTHLTPEEEACIDRRPTLKKGGLKDLPNDSKLRNYLTTSPGMPTLEVEWL